MVSVRENGIGDIIWVTLERVGGSASDTHTDSIALINIQASYRKWNEGIHI